jgi:hypothetical protein
MVFVREWDENIYWGMIPVQKRYENIQEWGENIYWPLFNLFIINVINKKSPKDGALVGYRLPDLSIL